MGIALALAGAGLLAFLLFHLLLFRFGADQAWCALVADGLLRGEMPYRDMWIIRPPGIFPFYAAGQLLFGKNMVAIRLVEAAALLSLFVAFPYFSRRHVGSAAPGFAGALLAIMIHVQLDWWNTAQSESFGGIALAWALLLVTWRPESPRRQHLAWFGAAALMTFSAMLKPHMGGSFVLCLALVVWTRYRAAEEGRHAASGPGAVLGPILAFGFGGVMVVAATLLPFVATGAFADLVWTFREMVPGYARVTPESQHLLPGLWRAVHELLADYSPTLLLPGLALWALLPPLGGREREGVLYLIAAIAPQVLGVALQAKFFLYHYDGMLLLVALWSAWGFFKLWLRIRHRPVSVLLLVAAMTLAQAFEQSWFWRRCGLRWEALLNAGRRAEIENRLYSASGHYYGEIQETAAWLRANTPPDARVLVWGPQAGIYFLSDRRPASRFIGNGVLRSTWGQEPARKILEAELAAALPAVVVVSHEDRPHWVTGHKLDSAESLDRYPWLRRTVENNYYEVVRFGRLQVHRLRGELRDAASPPLSTVTPSPIS